MKVKTLLVAVYVCVLVVTLALPVAASAAPLPQADGPQQTLPDGSIVGVPWTGERGITETVAQIMEREETLRRSNASHPRVTKPWLDYSSVRPKAGNPGALLVSQWPPIGVSATDIGPHSPQTVGTSFTGVLLSESGYIPPDSMGDVGPTQILMHENGRIKVFDKAGNLGGLNATDATFWASVAAGISDPEVRYDRLSGRWFVLAISIAEAVNNEIVVAVSSGPTITNQSSFTFYQFNVGTVATGDANSFCDYPSLGIDMNALYTGCNMFNSLGSFVWTSAFVIRKSSVTSGGPIVVTGFTNIGSTTSAGPYAPRGVDNDDPCATEGYIIGADPGFLNRLNFRRVTSPGGTPVLSANVTVTIANTNMSPQVALGSTTNIDASDHRFFMASIHKNKITGVSSLWTAHVAEVNTSCVAATSRNYPAHWSKVVRDRKSDHDANHHPARDALLYGDRRQYPEQ